MGGRCKEGSLEGPRRRKRNAMKITVPVLRLMYKYEVCNHKPGEERRFSGPWCYYKEARKTRASGKRKTSTSGAQATIIRLNHHRFPHQPNQSSLSCVEPRPLND